MQQGAALHIFPSWISGFTVIDMMWETTDLGNAMPTGPWWGQLALLAGTGSGSGIWKWQKSLRRLDLWVPHPDPPNPLKLLALLDGFTLPTTPTDKGSGHIPHWLFPVSGDLPFTWEAQHHRTSLSEPPLPHEVPVSIVNGIYEV